VLEGMPAIVLGAVAFFVLTDWPGEAGWLAPEQRQWVDQHLEKGKASVRQASSVGQVLRSRTVKLLAATAFFDYFAAYVMIFWLPTILKRQSGLSDMRVGLLGAIPYAVAFIAMLINGWHSDRNGERRWHSAAPAFIAAISLLALIRLPGSTSITVVLLSTACIISAFLPAFWAIPTETLSESAAAATVGMVNAVGSIAGFAGPYAFGYLHTRTGTFSYGFAMVTVFALVAGVLVLLTPKARLHVNYAL